MTSLTEKLRAIIESCTPPAVVHRTDNPIDAVSFDLDDVLIPTTVYTRIAHMNGLRRFLQTKHPGLAEEEMVAQIEPLYAQLEQIIIAKGSNYHRHYDRLFEQIGETDPQGYAKTAQSGYKDAVRSLYHPNPFIIHAVEATAQETKGRIGVTTSHEYPVKQLRKLEMSGLLPLFDPASIMVTGNQRIASKRQGISILVQQFGITPDTIAHIDDRLSCIEQVNDVQTIFFRNRAGKYCVGKRKEHYTQLSQTPNYIIDNLDQIPGIIAQSRSEISQTRRYNVPG